MAHKALLNPGIRMSGKIASLIALVPMLFHSIFGCCWHHVHFLPEHGLAVVAQRHHEVSGDVEQVHTHHTGCCHAHRSPEPSPGDFAESEGHPSELPPCEDEDRCLYNAAVITSTVPTVSFEGWAFIHLPFSDMRLRQPSKLTMGSELIERSQSITARQRCAITQVWLV